MVTYHDYGYLNGILLINKPIGITSSKVVSIIKRMIGRNHKVGHAGTLDPDATGLLVILIGKKYTQQFHSMLTSKKTYITNIQLGMSTDTYDHTGSVTQIYQKQETPSLDDVQRALDMYFTGAIQQTAPLYSAKKWHGTPLYKLARNNNQEIIQDLKLPVSSVELECSILSYEYPDLSLQVTCSSGTYIRSIAHDLGQCLQTFGHTDSIYRVKVGRFSIENSIFLDELLFMSPSAQIQRIKQSLIHD